jgi:hypothetical protein
MTGKLMTVRDGDVSRVLRRYVGMTMTVQGRLNHH